MSIVWESNLLSHGVSGELAEKMPRLIKECYDHGLDPYPLVIEEYTADEIAELGAYGGFPVRYPHFSFGQQYENLYHQYHSGMGKIYEMVVNTDPTYMYLQKNNPVVDNLTVVAHALAHSDFFKNNICFKHTNRNMMNVMANHGQKIRSYMDMFGQGRVLNFLDACLSIDDLIDPALVWKSSKLKKPARHDFDDRNTPEDITRIPANDYMDRFVNPKGYINKQRRTQNAAEIRRDHYFPETPERDIMLFILNHIRLKPWQQNILSMVRDEAIYYRPQVITKVMNEGWASYWDSYIMTKCGFAGDDGIIDYAKHHAGVLGGKYNLNNPYKLGNCLLNDIKDRWDKGRFGKEWNECDDEYVRQGWDKKLNLGTEKIFEVREHYNDVTFLNEFFTRDFCEKYKFFEYQLTAKNTYEVVSKDHKKIKEKLIKQYTNGGKPIIYLENLRHNDNEIMLYHEFDGRPLDKKYVKGVLGMLYKITRRVINITTLDTSTSLVFDNDMNSSQKISKKRIAYRYDGKEFKTIEKKKTRPKMWGTVGTSYYDV
jgi:stage V sporulation protein R